MENTPYHKGALNYLIAGWTPLPLPYAEKFPPPEGYTGGKAVVPTEETVLEEWFEHGGNIALKMPSDVIGIDVDRADMGYRTFKRLLKRLGDLPISYVIANREKVEDGFTAFFKVPEGIEWKASAGYKIDVIQSHHRYQTAPPSIHPEGRVYEWRTISGQPIPFIPEIDSFPELPEKWIKHLTKPKKVVKSYIRPEDKIEVVPEYSPDLDILMADNCLMMKSILNKHMGLLRSVSSRHDAAVLATWAIVSEGRKGHKGGLNALDTYRRKWESMFSKEEGLNRSLRHEFDSMVSTAIEKQEGSQGASCGCGKGKGKTPRQRPTKVADFKMWK